MSTVVLFIVLWAIVGVLSLLYGKSLVRVLCAVYAFLLAQEFMVNHFPQVPYIFVISLVVGIVAMLLAGFARKVAFFLLGFVIGYLLTNYALIYFPMITEWYVFAICVAIGIILGIITVKFENVLLRYLTAFLGGYMLIVAGLIIYQGNFALIESGTLSSTLTNMFQYLGSTSLTSYYPYIWIGSVLLMGLGAWFQSRHH